MSVILSVDEQSLKIDNICLRENEPEFKHKPPSDLIGFSHEFFFGKIPYFFFYFASLKNIFAACESVELCLKQNTHCKVSISIQVVIHE